MITTTMVDSTWARGSPVLVLGKKDGCSPMAIDYRSLNKVTLMRKYPLPLVEQLLGTIKVNSVFSAIDLTMAYHHMGIKKEDQTQDDF